MKWTKAPATMVEAADPGLELKRIRAMLDQRVEIEGSEDESTYERVLDVVRSFEAWSDLAIRRLHEIHRLSGEACPFCVNWLDVE